jgi:uncharacterized surface protein with fasciclin (FAS1) repeats
MKKLLKLLTVAFLSLFVYQMALAADTSDKNAQKDIVQVAMHQKNLSTFVKALKAAGLVDTLKGTGPYTVFAPTNSAFSKLPKGTLNKLLKDKSQLASILSYNVISGKTMTKDIQNGPVNTLQGQPVTLDNTNGTVRVNNAKVAKSDIEASNGVIHEIDAVLMPNTQNPGATSPQGTPNTQNVPGQTSQQGPAPTYPATDTTGTTDSTGASTTTNSTTTTTTSPSTSPTTAPNAYPNTPDNNTNNQNPNTLNNPNAVTPTPSNPNPNTPAAGGPTNTNMYQPSIPTQQQPTTTPSNE